MTLKTHSTSSVKKFTFTVGPNSIYLAVCLVGRTWCSSFALGRLTRGGVEVEALFGYWATFLGHLGSPPHPSLFALSLLCGALGCVPSRKDCSRWAWRIIWDCDYHLCKPKARVIQNSLYFPSGWSLISVILTCNLNIGDFF